MADSFGKLVFRVHRAMASPLRGMVGGTRRQPGVPTDGWGLPRPKAYFENTGLRLDSCLRSRALTARRKFAGARPSCRKPTLSWFGLRFSSATGQSFFGIVDGAI